MGAQRWFALISRDSNPMHLDAIAARRTQAGATVVHGIHAVLWALDELSSKGLLRQPVSAVAVSFKRFMYVDSLLELYAKHDYQHGLRAEIRVDGEVATTIDLSPFVVPSRIEICSGRPIPIREMPTELSWAEIGNVRGALTALATEDLEVAFPNAASVIEPGQIAAIAGLSALVGMVCPGLHSLFSDFSVELVANSVQRNDLQFLVSNVDNRFRSVEMSVSGGGIVGKVSAFLREPPIEPFNINALRDGIVPDEFASVNALVIGGSRGLGATAARIIVAGGGHVTVTYLVGEAEAQRAVHDLGADHCAVLRYDAREPAAPQLAQTGRHFEQLYYFATPKIFRQAGNAFSPERFREFCTIYVDGFADACDAVYAAGHLSVFYPSSVAVEDPPRELREYAMAKAAGELLCVHMSRFAHGRRVITCRLPRMLTDQTMTISPTRTADQLEVMLPIIREMRNSGPS